RWAVRLLEDCNIDDLDGGTDDNRGYKSLTHGSAPDIHGFQSLDEQVDFIKTYLDTRFAEDVPPGHICIVARTGG
ncbi:MAG: DNA helicase, partial [Candidatus Competibacteraceae bacterium]|nr:DNA helicase [Candidatus Competibacteraceae bacterium]